MSSSSPSFKRQKAARAKRLTSYATREEQVARKHSSPLPYFRLQDSFCKSYLEMAAAPREFQGLQLLFPFVRTVSLLRFTRNQDMLSTWMQFAFISGHDLGRAYPDRLDDVLPGCESREAEKRLAVLQSRSGEDRFS